MSSPDQMNTPSPHGFDGSIEHWVPDLQQQWLNLSFDERTVAVYQILGGINPNNGRPTQRQKRAQRKEQNDGKEGGHWIGKTI